MVDLNLKGRIALVTGGESGIGAACVAALAAAGADVGVIYYKDREAGEASASVATGLGRKGIAMQADVGKEGDVEAAFDAVEKAIGIPDILINSAGKNMSGVKVADMSTGQWQDLLATDLTGCFFTSRRFVRNLKGSGRAGAIVNITSIHSSVMRAGGADYDAAKGGQTNLTKTLSLEVAEHGITVNAIAPGMILTPMNGKAFKDPTYADKLAQNIPLKRPGKPEEVAGVAVFLASPAGAYITGSTVTIDGGLSLELGQGGMSLGFEVEKIDDVIIDGPEELTAQNLMSPFMWRAGRHDAGLMALIRAVPRHRSDDQESGRIWYGRSASNGLYFRMDDAPVLVPGPHGKDSTGCEDPTVVATEDGYVVFYTGVDSERTGHLLYATGPDMHSLEKRSIALPNGKTEDNNKEATLLRSDGVWRLLYEYAHDGHSLISLTEGDSACGPWNEQPDPFWPRPDKWDSWHLSTGPLLLTNPKRPVMFYNGADKDADWGIGWVALSPDLREVVARCDGPLIAPPTDATGPRDIAFAASIVETEGTIWLYYSRNDRELKRATLRQTG